MDNLIPVGLALTKLLKEYLELDNHWREKFKWITELANEANEISLLFGVGLMKHPES